MKKIMVLLLFLSINSVVYSQKTQFDDFYAKNNSNCKSYDEESNITQVVDYNNVEFFVSGKWKDFEYANFKVNYITHCPMLINNEKLILELWIRDEKKYKLDKFSSEIVLNEVNRVFCLTVEKKKLAHTILEFNQEKNYYIYEIIEENTKRIEFLGVKNKKIYRFALFEVGSTSSKLDENFLTDIYNNN